MLPRTAGSPPFIFFSTSYPELDSDFEGRILQSRIKRYQGVNRFGRLEVKTGTIIRGWHQPMGPLSGGGWKSIIHPEDLPRLGSARDADRSHWCEARLRRSDGAFRWFLLQQKAIRDDAGAVVRWYGIATEIEQRKQVETLRAAEKHTLEMIADGASLRDVLDQLCSSIDVQVAPSVTTVLLVDGDGKQLWQGGGLRVPPEWISAIIPVPVAFEAGLCGTAAFLKARVIVPDVATEPNWPDQYRDLALRNGIRAAWSEPILTKDKEVLGTFALYSHESRVPTDEDVALIEGAGHIARIAIERQRSQEALRKALAEIKKSEAKLWQVIDTIPTLAWCNLPDGPNEFLNKRWHEYTGLSPEESHGWGWQAAFHSDDLPPLMERWRELLISGQAGQIEARLRRHDGVFRWFLIRVEPLHDESGKLIRWYGTSTDIEALKQTEEKLREDERELRRITDAIPQTIVVLNEAGIPVYANQATLDYTGLTAGDVLAPRFRERIFHPEDLERLRDVRTAALGRGLPFEVEQRALRRDGQYRWFLIRYNPFRNEQGQVIRWYATGTDIDDRVRLEERTRNENLALREQIDRESMFEDIVGSSEALRKVLRQVARVAPSDSTVLILGETGTGKELIARAIHKRSKRADRAFIGVNCAAIPTSLIASELFGHENKPISIDVRVLAATHHDLEALVAEGRFRQDLLYRVSVVPIQMPSLRERREDIPLLVEYFISRFGKKAGKKFGTIDKKTVRLFESYQWPGNVRELQNVIERAAILSEDDTFSVDEAWLNRNVAQFADSPTALNRVLLRHEKEMIESALAESAGRVSGPSGAAAKLRIPTRTLDSKIKRLGIDKFRFRKPQVN